jgi:hypothetical protein
MLLNLLLEKLYGHRSDLEFMMEVREMHCPDKSKKLSDQHAACLGNIQAYEMLLRQYNDELYSNSRKRY